MSGENNFFRSQKPDMNYWLMKSEPDVFSLKDLSERTSEPWNGVRSYEARNNMRLMKRGDLVLFYHSNASPSGVAGLAEICREAYPDETCYDPTNEYYDPKSTAELPRWDMVDLRYVETFSTFLSLDRIKQDSRLSDWRLLKASRLSVQPVPKIIFDLVCSLGRS
jgi:predicted RNA-binding protein with PUA-like domain